MGRIAKFMRKYLWQAPRGMVLKLTRNNGARLDRVIAGCDVAVVGNARSLLATDFGPQIDSADVVVRINKGFVVAPAAQGTRTDIWTVVPDLSDAEIAEHFAPRLILFLIPKLRHLRIYRPDHVARLAFYPWRHWFADRNHIGRRPSSGYMMISALLRRGGARSITLYGFDFGRSATFYNPEGYQTPHDFAAEERIILGWEQQGLVRIVRSP